MSRVQLALDVSNIDDAVAFYSKLFEVGETAAFCAATTSPEPVALGRTAAGRS